MSTFTVSIPRSLFEVKEVCNNVTICNDTRLCKVAKLRAWLGHHLSTFDPPLPLTPALSALGTQSNLIRITFPESCPTDPGEGSGWDATGKTRRSTNRSGSTRH
jgi:hypothetical protein